MITKAKEFIREHHTEDLSLPQVAQLGLRIAAHSPILASGGNYRVSELADYFLFLRRGENAFDQFYIYQVHI